MKKRTFIIQTSALLALLCVSVSTAVAKSNYPAAAPAAYYTGGSMITGTNQISCFTCHSSSPQTENNVTTSFGVGFKQNSNDDNAGSLLTAYNFLLPYDSDGDGFSNQQEAFAGSDLNGSISIPLLVAPDINIRGSISAKSITGGPVNEASIVTGVGVPTTVLGGIAAFTTPYNNITTIGTSTDFIFAAGGVQTGATVEFYDNNRAIIAQTPANTADAGYIVKPSIGSINITVKDEGVFDLYTTAVFQADAIAAYTAFSKPLQTAPNIDPYAKVSILATVDPYAIIDAYAVVDDYAVVGAYAKVGSYAYIQPSVDVYAGVINTYAQIDPYVNVTSNITVPGITALPIGVGTVSAKFAVTTTRPTPLLLGITGSSSVGGGLHCMTSGLSTYALMFFGLFMAGFLVKRKRS